MQLRPVTRQSVSDAVFEQLAGEIVGGRLQAGDPLPAERALTEALQVNRQAVREALKRLSQAGLVDISHGGATRVRDYRRSASLDLLPRLLLDPEGAINPAVIRSIMEMRAAIGPDVARLAAQRSTPDATDLIADLVGQLADAGDDLARLVDLDLAFWDALVAAADNVAYQLAINSMRQVYEPASGLLRDVLAPELQDLDSHRAIATAVADGDPAAAEHAARTLLAKGTVAVTSLIADLAPAADRSAP